MSVRPSARRSCSVMYCGASQIGARESSRSVVVSGGPSSASDVRGPRRLAALAADRVARKSRRDWTICIKAPFGLCEAWGSPPRRPVASGLQLALELVEEAPVGALGDQRVRARLDHADLVQAQRVEAHRVLRVELAPAIVGKLPKRLQRVIVLRRPAAIDQTSRSPFRVGGADVSGLEDGSQKALGGDRMVLDKVPGTVQHAAEVLRP